MYLDWTYILLVLPAVIFSIIASAKVDSTFKKYSKIFSSRNVTAESAASTVLENNGVGSVGITHIAGNLTDNFDPSTNIIKLSDPVYGSTSVAAIGVACHEAGHAVQHAVGYKPIKFRSAIVNATNLGSKLSMPLILIGIVLSSVAPIFAFVAYLGVALFSLCVVFQLVTLPTEFNASRRALNALKQYDILTDDELKGAKKVLSAAAMTYVAALSVSVMQLLRLMLMVSGTRGRRR